VGRTRIFNLGPVLKISARVIAVCALLTVANSVFSEIEKPLPPSHDVVQLAATGSVEVVQDLLSISMTTTRDGPDAATVQSQLKAALDAALAKAREAAQPGQLDVRTGNFGLYPRYGRDGKSIGWQGSVELILEGRDFARISSTAGKIQTLTVASVSFGLSREQRSKVENEAQAIAIDRFKARALDIARSFGFAGYTLREVNVNAGEPGFAARPRMMAMEARGAAADAAVPVEAGKTAVLVTVSGSVQMK
jgi:predicted secreted protein